MKKVIRVLLFLLPIAVYIFIFFLYEPYNFYGLRESYGDRGSPITMIRKVKNNPTATKVLLGTSKTANLYPTYLWRNGVILEDWLNLSMTGASISELSTLLQEALELSQLKSVVLSTGFYSTNLGGVNRFTESDVQTLMSMNEMDYFFNSATHQHVIKNFLKQPLHEALYESKIDGQLGFEIPIEHEGNKESYWEEKYADYIKRVWKPYVESFSPVTSYIAQIIDMYRKCEEKGIDFAVVTMPLYKTCFDFLNTSLLSPISNFYKDFLSLYMSVYDMEYDESEWTEYIGYYLDGAHLNGINFLPGENSVVEDVYRTLFCQNGKQMRVLYQEPCFEKLIDETGISMMGSETLEYYANNVHLDKNTIYVMRCKGTLPRNAEVLYCDLYDPKLENTGKFSIGVPERIGESDEYILFLRTDELINTECTFRMIYIGQEQVQIDSLELLKYDWALSR